MSQGPISVAPAQLANGNIGFLKLDANGNLQVVQAESPVSTRTPLAASSGNVAAGTAAATLASVAGKTTYLAGFSVTGLGATAAGLSTVTVTGLAGGTLTFIFPVPAGATVGATPLNIYFDTPAAASAAHVDIVVSATTFGSGNTNSAVNAWGFNQ